MRSTQKNLFAGRGERAEVLLPKKSSGALVLDIEPGPGVKGGPFDLEIEGVGKLRIEQRSIVKVPIAERVILRAHGGGYILANDPRVLNFRMFDCKVQTEPVRAPSVEPRNFLRGMARNLLGTREAPVDGNFIRQGFTLHIYACGDFTLMAREHWFDLRGYAELDMYSMHIDSLLCWAAHFAGVQEQVLEDPLRTYHIDHSVGSGWTPEGGAQLFTRLEKTGIPSLDYRKLNEWVKDMRELRTPMIFSGENWGLAADTLTETHVPID